jgi:serine/arginine repetitive matrix protein 1
MSLGSYYRGTTHEQDARFKNKDKKLLEALKYPKEFETKINIDKVELKVIRTWVENKLNEFLGFEDEFCTNYAMNMLENKNEDLDPRKLQMYLTRKLKLNFSIFGQQSFYIYARFMENTNICSKQP